MLQMYHVPDPPGRRGANSLVRFLNSRVEAVTLAECISGYSSMSSGSMRTLGTYSFTWSAATNHSTEGPSSSISL